MKQHRAGMGACFDRVFSGGVSSPFASNCTFPAFFSCCWCCFPLPQFFFYPSIFCKCMSQILFHEVWAFWLLTSESLAKCWTEPTHNFTKYFSQTCFLFLGLLYFQQEVQELSWHKQCWSWEQKLVRSTALSYRVNSTMFI